MEGAHTGAVWRNESFLETAERYSDAHRLKETLETLLSELLLVQPEDPLAYLCTSISKKIRDRDGMVRAETVKDVNTGASPGTRSAYLAKVSSEQKNAGRADSLLIVHFNDVYNIQERDKSPCGGAARFCGRVEEICKEREADGKYLVEGGRKSRSSLYSRHSTAT